MKRAWQLVNAGLVAQVLGGLVVAALLVLWQSHTGQSVKWRRGVPVAAWSPAGGTAVVAVLAGLSAGPRRRGPCGAVWGAGFEPEIAR